MSGKRFQRVENRAGLLFGEESRGGLYIFPRHSGYALDVHKVEFAHNGVPELLYVVDTIIEEFVVFKRFVPDDPYHAANKNGFAADSGPEPYFGVPREFGLALVYEYEGRASFPDGLLDRHRKDVLLLSHIGRDDQESL